MENNNNHNAWIQTFTGKKFYPFNPKPEDIDIRDIAHALSNICRFTGHTKRFHSVAAHSIGVAQLVPESMQLQALLHDASEAYLCDIARPIKRREDMQPYRVIECCLQATIYERFGLPATEPPELRQADARMCGAEALALMEPLIEPECWRWCTDLVDGKEHVSDLQPANARLLFLRFFQQYGGRA
jgi:hypothetical protein